GGLPRRDRGGPMEGTPADTLAGLHDLAARRQQSHGAGDTVSAPGIAVIIVTWNSARVLPGLLTTLDAGLGSLTGQTIVVDNDSADDSVAVARRVAPHCRIVQTGRNAGYAAAINAGLAAADPYDAALILNPDIRLDTGAVETMSARLSDEGV